MAWSRRMVARVPGVLIAVLVVACGSGPGEADGVAAGDTAAEGQAEDATAATGLHALGQEPGWMVDITPDGRMRVLARYGTDTITAPAPAPTRAPDGATVYRIATDEHAVTVTVEDEPCRDAMSGRPFPATVTLELDGEVFRGCGRRGAARSEG